MAAKASSMKEELCCSVCKDFYKDPVLLKCSHSFCRTCLQKFWEQKSSRECPMCRSKSSDADPPLNMALRNIVDVYLKQRSECGSAKKSESLCSRHGQKLLLFCVEDLEPICLVCQTAAKHRDHRVCLLLDVELDKEDFRASLIPLKEKLEKFEETAKDINNQFHHTEKRIKEEFEKLHQLLREEEEARLAVLREEEVQKSQRMKEKIDKISKQVSTLSEKIRDIEKGMDAEGISYLKAIKDTKENVQCSLQDPELESGVLIDVAKHLGSLKFRVLEKMLGTVQYTPVTLDPNTADPWLSVSDDLTSVRHRELVVNSSDNPERPRAFRRVLDSRTLVGGTGAFNTNSLF